MIVKNMRRKITNETWQQIDTAIVSGIGEREIARNMGIPEGTVLSHAKRKGLTRQIQSATALAKRDDKSNTITPIEGVVATLNERKDKSRLNLSKYVVDASGRAANSRGDLSIASRVRSLSEIHGDLWPQQTTESAIQVNVLSFAAIKPVEREDQTRQVSE